MAYKRKSNVGKVIFNIFFWLVFASLGVIIVNRVIDQNDYYLHPLFGYRMTVIVTPSMATVNPVNESYITPEMSQIQVNDAITTQTYNSYESIQIYDVATYYKEGVLICHRVVDKYEDASGQYIVFRGDANNANDTPVLYSEIRGKVINITPGFGDFLSFTQSTWGRVAIVSFFVTVYVLVSLLFRDKKAISDPAEQDS